MANFNIPVFVSFANCFCLPKEKKKNLLVSKIMCIVQLGHNGYGQASESLRALYFLIISGGLENSENCKDDCLPGS